MAHNYFPKLNQRFVRIDMSESESFNCPMLPIADMTEIESILESLGKAVTLKDDEKIRHRMIALISKVLPEQYRDGLSRLAIDQLQRLIGYLMWGDPQDDDQPVEEAKKN